MVSTIFWLVVLSLFVVVGAIYLVLTLRLRVMRAKEYVPFIPADRKGIAAIFTLVDVKSAKKVIDLGSGWGTIIFSLARQYPQLSLTGVEINPLLHIAAVCWQLLFYRKSNVQFICKDAASVRLDSYDTVFLFMLPTFTNTVLVPKFEQELPLGATVVSYVFPINLGNTFVEEKLSVHHNGWRNAVYVYRKK